MGDSPLWELAGRQLRHPHGWGGGVAGAAMRVLNSGPNRAAIAALDPRPGQALMELGFGPGEGIAALCRLAPDGVVHGLDQSQAMLRQAQRRNAAAVRRGQARLRLGDFARLEIPDGSLDGLLAVNVVYFWGDGAAVLAGAWRALRPGGRLALYATDAAAMRRWKFARPDTHRLFDRAGLHGFLAQGPFQPQDVSVTAAPMPFGVPGLVALARKPPAAAGPTPAQTVLSTIVP